MRELLEQVNRSIRALAVELDSEESSTWPFVCECGEANCTERLGLSVSRYDTLKQADDAVLAPGHRAQQFG